MHQTFDAGRLLEFLEQLRVAHWNADTKSNEHEALGELYEKIDGLTDQFVETFLGKYGGKVKNSEEECDCEDDIQALINEGYWCVEEMKKNLEDDAEGLMNIVADMCNAIDHAAYKLKVEIPEEEEEKGPDEFSDEEMP